MDEDLKKLEEDLGKLSPLGMPDDLLARLDQAMCRWHEEVPEQEKVISFKPTAPAISAEHAAAATNVAAPRRSRTFPHLSSAAAVAALGVLSAHFYLQSPETETSVPLADIQNASVSDLSPASAASMAANSRNISTASSEPANFLPVSATTNVVNAADRGIVYMPNGQAARCLAIHYQDQLEYKNNKGEHLKLNKPELKVIYLPLKTD